MVMWVQWADYSNTTRLLLLSQTHSQIVRHISRKKNQAGEKNYDIAMNHMLREVSSAHM